MEALSQFPYIKAEEISLSFSYPDGQEEIIFENAGLKAAEGVITYLTGTTGCGKSLMLRLLCCLPFQESQAQISFSGSVNWGDRPVREIPAAQVDVLRARRFGIVFQGLSLVEEITGRENILFPLSVLKLDKMVHLERCRDYFAGLEVEGFWNKEVNTLSGGQKQRIAVSRALITDPKVIVADEPTSGLDARMAGVVHDILEQERARGKIVVIVTHDDRRVNILGKGDAARHFWIDDFNNTIRRLAHRTADSRPPQSHCPRCGPGQNRWIQSKLPNSSVTIDLCGKCGGVWLDAGEWDAILAYPRSIMAQLEGMIENLKKGITP